MRKSRRDLRCDRICDHALGGLAHSTLASLRMSAEYPRLERRFFLPDVLCFGTEEISAPHRATDLQVIGRSSIVSLALGVLRCRAVERVPGT